MTSSCFQIFEIDLSLKELLQLPRRFWPENLGELVNIGFDDINHGLKTVLFRELNDGRKFRLINTR